MVFKKTSRVSLLAACVLILTCGLTSCNQELHEDYLKVKYVGNEFISEQGQYVTVATFRVEPTSSTTVERVMYKVVMEKKKYNSIKKEVKERGKTDELRIRSMHHGGLYTLCEERGFGRENKLVIWFPTSNQIPAKSISSKAFPKPHYIVKMKNYRGEVKELRVDTLGYTPHAKYLAEAGRKNCFKMTAL